MCLTACDNHCPGCSSPSAAGFPDTLTWEGKGIIDEIAVGSGLPVAMLRLGLYFGLSLTVALAAMLILAACLWPKAGSRRGDRARELGS